VIRSLVEQVRADVRRRILAGEWTLGRRIYEDALATEFGVSRGPVREALRLLEQEGLVERRSHRGLFVALPDWRAVAEVAAVRALLEGHAVAGAGRIAPAVLARLEACCEAMDAAVGADDRLGAVLLDLEFHRTVAGQSPNRMLRRKFEELDGHIAIFFHGVAAVVPDALAGLGDRHRVVVAALREGTPEAMREAIAHHYEEAALRFRLYADAWSAVEPGRRPRGEGRTM
jgi:DNA-binding GntR family transcriptional regulator